MMVEKRIIGGRDDEGERNLDGEGGEERSGEKGSVEERGGESECGESRCENDSANFGCSSSKNFSNSISSRYAFYANIFNF